jgi:thiol-disulfide isomerase/thioredoxin
MYLKVNSSNEASKLSNLMKDGNWIVLYYANWCGHCNTMKPEWQKVISRMNEHNNKTNNKTNNANTNNSSINIADIESSHIDDLTDKPEIAGFPTIKMYNSGHEIANFEDERVADKIHQFAITNSKNSKNSNNINNSCKTTNTNLNTNKIIHEAAHKATHKSKSKSKSKSKDKAKAKAKAKATRKSKNKSKSTRKSGKATHKKKSVYGANHRLPPKMINLNMKNDLTMPQNISKIIGLD